METKLTTIHDNEEFEIVEKDKQEMTAQKRNTKATCWVGTWNNPKMTDGEFLAHLQKLEDDGYLQYAIFQREQGECGTIHFQYFINWVNARYFKWIKETALPYGCHFKPMYKRSTKTACRTYCSKPDTRISETFYEVGEFIEQGNRSDLAKIIELMNEGVPLSSIRKIYPTQCVMYSRQLKEHEQSLLQEAEEENFRHLKITYIWGKTGTGKTKFIIDKFGYKDVWRVKFYDGRAFDKYYKHKVLVFDEFRSPFKIGDMLHFLDGHPMDLPCRYVDKTACYTHVYIVSNIPLNKQYPNIQNDEPATWQAFMRRIENVYHFDNEEDRRKLFADEPNPNRLYEGNFENGMRVLSEEECADMPF